MALDGVLAETERVGDFAVGQPLGHQPQHLPPHAAEVIHLDRESPADPGPATLRNSFSRWPAMAGAMIASPACTRWTASSNSAIPTFFSK